MNDYKHKQKERNPALYEQAAEVLEKHLSRRTFIGQFSMAKKPWIKFDQERASAIKLVCRSERAAQAAIANPDSVAAALLESASVGLTLYPTLSYAYLVPETYADKQSIQLVIGYKGMEHMALRSKCVKQITTELVYSNDTFRRGMREDGSVFVEFESARGDRGSLEGGFCRAIMSNKTIHVEWMDVEEIKGCEAAATIKQRGTPASWSGAFKNEMQKKCVVRRAAKHWVLDETFARTLEVMDKIDPMDFNGSNEPVERITKEHVDEIAAMLFAKGIDQEKVAVWIDRQCEAISGEPGGTKSFPDSKWQEVRDKLEARADKMAAIKAEQAAKDAAASIPPKVQMTLANVESENRHES